MLKVTAFEIKIKVDLLFIKSLMQITKKQIIMLKLFYFFTPGNSFRKSHASFQPVFCFLCIRL